MYVDRKKFLHKQVHYTDFFVLSKRGRECFPYFDATLFDTSTYNVFMDRFYCIFDPQTTKFTDRFPVINGV